MRGLMVILTRALYRTDRCIDDSSRDDNGPRSCISPSAFIGLISLGRVCSSISSARSRPLRIVRLSSFPTRPRPSSHLATARFALPFRSISLHNQRRRPFDLVSCSALSSTCFTASVSAHAMQFSVWCPTSPPERHTDACASPRRVPVIWVQLSQDLRPASIAPLPASRWVVAGPSSWPGDPAIPVALLVYSPCETGFSRAERSRMCNMNDDY
jgi:hypothetical protein